MPLPTPPSPRVPLETLAKWVMLVLLDAKDQLVYRDVLGQMASL